MEITFDPELHIYRVDGREMPSVTTILKTMGVSYIEGIPPEQLEASRQWGSVVHKWTEIMDKGEMGEYDAPPTAVMPCLMAWEQFKEDHKVEIIDIEKVMYNEAGGYCGTIDRRMMIDGKRTVCDIKTSTSFYASTGVQLTAYMEEKDEDVIAVHLLREGSYAVYGTKKYGKQRKVWINIPDAKADWDMVVKLYKKYRGSK